MCVYKSNIPQFIIRMNLPEDYTSLIQNEYNKSIQRSSFRYYTKAYSIDELYKSAAEINTQNTKVRDEILGFNKKFPDSYITLEKFGITDKDIDLYYKCKTTRSVYRLSQQRSFRLENINEYLSDKITNGRCKLPLLYILLLITIIWITLLVLLLSPSQADWTIIFVPFAAVGFASSISVITYIVLLLLTIVYNFYMTMKNEKEDRKYYENDSTTKAIRNLSQQQYQYIRSSIMIPLPRITIKYLKKELGCGFSGIPSNITTEEIAKEVLAIVNGSLYRNGLFTPHYCDKISSNIDKIICVTPHIAKATNILGMTIEHWKQIAHDIVCIGVIRSASRDKTDYRKEYDKSLRKEMLKMYHDTLIYALDHFEISEEEWLEIGEEVLRHHNVYDRNCLMTYGYISEPIRKYHFIELL